MLRRSPGVVSVAGLLKRGKREGEKGECMKEIGCGGGGYGSEKRKVGKGKEDNDKEWVVEGKEMKGKEKKDVL